MRIIGLTGGIASGKSTVSNVLHDLGAVVIDADSIAREVVDKDGKALDEIADYFGSRVLDNNGELDRKKLGELVFEDKEKLEMLNKITHKYILERMRERFDEELQKADANALVLDAPLPVEQGFQDVVDEIWVVSSDRNTRIGRLIERNGYTEEEAIKRIDAQMTDEEYLKLSDEVIYNDGSVEELERQVVKLFYK